MKTNSSTRITIKMNANNNLKKQSKNQQFIIVNYISKKIEFGYFNCFTINDTPNPEIMANGQRLLS